MASNGRALADGAVAMAVVTGALLTAALVSWPFTEPASGPEDP